MEQRNKQEYIIDIPLDEITCRGIYLGENSGILYFKIDDGRYALLKKQEVFQKDNNRICLLEKLDVRPTEHFISRKDREIIQKLEEEIKWN